MSKSRIISVANSPLNNGVPKVLSHIRYVNCCATLSPPEWTLLKRILVNDEKKEEVDIVIPPCTDVETTYEVCVNRDGGTRVCVLFDIRFNSSFNGGDTIYTFHISVTGSQGNDDVVLLKCETTSKINKGLNIVHFCCCEDVDTTLLQSIVTDIDGNIKLTLDDLTVNPNDINLIHDDETCSCLITVNILGTNPSSPPEINLTETLKCNQTLFDPSEPFAEFVTEPAKYEYTHIYTSDLCDDICGKTITNTVIAKTDNECFITADKAKLKVECCELKLETTPPKVSCQDRWFVCKEAKVETNGDPCSRSPGYWKTHGPDGDGCRDCQPGNNPKPSVWPNFDPYILATTKPLTPSDLCYLLNVIPGNADCGPFKLAPLLFQWVATLFNKNSGVVLPQSVLDAFNAATVLLKQYVSKENENAVIITDPDDQVLANANVLKDKLEDFISETHCGKQCIAYTVTLTADKEAKVYITDGQICLDWKDGCEISGNPAELDFVLCVYDTEIKEENLIFCDNTIKPGECINDLLSYFYTYNVNLSDYLGKTLKLVVNLHKTTYNVKTGKYTSDDPKCIVASGELTIPGCDNIGAEFCDKFKFNPEPVNCKLILEAIVTGTDTENALTQELVDKFNADGKVTDGEKQCIVLPSPHDHPDPITLKYKLCIKDCCVNNDDGKLCVTNKASVQKVDPYNLCTYENVSSTTNVIYVGKCKILATNIKVVPERKVETKTKVDVPSVSTKNTNSHSIRRKIVNLRKNNQ